ncbi:hypothetical protein BH10BAC4_BH10BAC4_04750 [soil metagenome]
MKTDIKTKKQFDAVKYMREQLEKVYRENKDMTRYVPFPPSSTIAISLSRYLAYYT